MYKVWGLSCSYLTERRSCLLSLILTRMYPTWCHHSTRLKILLSVNADIEKVPPVGCEKICSTRSQFTPQFWPDFLVHLLLRRGKETRVFAFCFALTWHVAPLVSVKQHERNINARSLNSRPSVLDSGKSTLCNRSWQTIFYLMFVRLDVTTLYTEMLVNSPTWSDNMWPNTVYWRVSASYLTKLLVQKYSEQDVHLTEYRIRFRGHVEVMW